jgi:hypothetical protein
VAAAVDRQYGGFIRKDVGDRPPEFTVERQRMDQGDPSMFARPSHGA